MDQLSAFFEWGKINNRNFNKIQTVISDVKTMKHKFLNTIYIVSLPLSLVLQRLALYEQLVLSGHREVLTVLLCHSACVLNFYILL